MADRKIARIIAVMVLALALPILAQTPALPDEAARLAYRKVYDAMPDSQGTGPYPARMMEDPALPGFTIYRPARLGRDRLGLVIWGNGACSDDGASARLHLAELASHGFLVIAPGRILSGPSAPHPEEHYQGYMKTTTDDLRRALDWALAENRRKGSAWFGRIDPRQVAVSGHSCGGMQAITLAADPRVHALMVMNSGIFPPNPYLTGAYRFEPSLTDGFHTPVLYVIGGSGDVGRAPALSDYARISHVPVFIAAKRGGGHEGTFAQANGGAAAQVAVAWLQWQFRHNRIAARRFVGAHCGLCVDPAWEVMRKGW